MTIKELKKELLLVNLLINYIYIMMFQLQPLILLSVHMIEICKDAQNMLKNISLIPKMELLVLSLQLLPQILNMVLSLWSLSKLSLSFPTLDKWAWLIRPWELIYNLHQSKKYWPFPQMPLINLLTCLVTLLIPWKIPAFILECYKLSLPWFQH